ncbi:cyclodeaminase/cyclohydrolase family protein [Paenibacillus campi]|uniref:cyclodeaminase/cyclohydrolase family protein n=1 Tax=Paenibacillus campi TaxID=3106031 RepID=UPI002AFE23DE|nr:cyclodeaminase/cyclohydrolase family protein [Paenibacillus sp. SGZ-1009]
MKVEQAGVNTVSWDEPLRRIMEQLARSEPTPGGGSVASIVAALGAAMTSMTANFSQGEGYEHIEQHVAQALQDMEYISSACEWLMVEDIEAFGQYIEALQLPKLTPQQQEERRYMIDELRIQSIDTPLRLMECCLYGMYSAAPLITVCNRTVLSDVGIGIILFEAAAHSSLLTVNINLVTLKDEQHKQTYAGYATVLMNKIIDRKMELLEQVQRRIYEKD